MASYYCANYYGSINCHNSVRQFGDLCAVCLVGFYPRSTSQGRVAKICLKSTNASTSTLAAMQSGIPQASEQWIENAKREQLRREEEHARTERIKRIKYSDEASTRKP